LPIIQPIESPSVKVERVAFEAMVRRSFRVGLRVGLRVADASVMPTIPSANTNAPTVMIGEFASRQLAAGRAGATS
jgi:choline dehydrogenase-like flavoprotein